MKFLFTSGDLAVVECESVSKQVIFSASQFNHLHILYTNCVFLRENPSWKLTLHFSH